MTTTDRPLNISTETWSFLLIALGCIMEILSHRFGIQNELGAAIVGAGTMAFTNTVKSHDTIATGSNPVVINSPDMAPEKKS